METTADYTKSIEEIENRIDALLNQMRLEEKIGQMTQAEKNSITPQAVAEYFIGSVLSGGGGNPAPNTPEQWRNMVTEYQAAALKTRLGIPIIYGVDAVHGHSNMRGAVIFPHNIGLGATRDADLIKRIARASAVEILATNVHWNFAPALSVPQDIRWGRTYEGYSENTEVVTELGAAYTHGLIESGVLPSLKHYVADGGTRWGSRSISSWLIGNNWQAPNEEWKIDQGDAQFDEEALRRIHLAPYIESLKICNLNAMASFSSWNGEKMHGNKYLLTDVLKGELGLRGFIVSDWMAIDQLHQDFYSCVVGAINAGVDMVMVPYDYKRFIKTLTQAVEKGDITEERINDAVRRILLAKFELGLFEQPYTEEALLNKIGVTEHREVAQEAVRKSLVLLKNDKQTLPILKDTERIFVAGRAANDLGMQCGGWSIDWQGQLGPLTDGTTILQGLLQSVNKAAQVEYRVTGRFEGHAPIGIVVVGEFPYAEGDGDRQELNISAEDITAIEKVRPCVDKLVVVQISGRPLIITEMIDKADAWVCAWLPGTEGQGVVDVLLGDYPFSGKLSYAIPRSVDQLPRSKRQESGEAALYEFGYGLTT